MDDNTFAAVMIGFGTIILTVIIWQIFLTARARMHGTDRNHKALTEPLAGQPHALDGRLKALSDDIQAIQDRVAALERQR